MTKHFDLAHFDLWGPAPQLSVEVIDIIYILWMILAYILGFIHLSPNLKLNLFLLSLISMLRDILIPRLKAYVQTYWGGETELSYHF